jgi:hypothetical protein
MVVHRLRMMHGKKRKMIVFIGHQSRKILNRMQCKNIKSNILVYPTEVKKDTFKTRNLR